MVLHIVERSAAEASGRRRCQLRRYRSSEKLKSILVPPISTILLAVLSFCPALVAATYSVIVFDGSEECFIARTPKQPAGRYVVSGNYDLLDDGTSARPLSVVLYDSKMKAVYKSRFGKSEDSFSVVGKAGQRYELCIQNGLGVPPAGGGMARSEGMDDDDAYTNPRKDGQNRKVGWALRVRQYSQWVKDKDAEDVTKEKTESEKKAEGLLELGNELLDSMETLMDHQAYLREREADHRALAESAFSLVLLWTVAEAAVLFVVAGGQIYYLRRFIERRSYL
mmetsp:Transcript_34672/g.75879  ORF Transcript_34672/g.75879 Transcript_34672/m.75879 type:complete len:281 (-) Transcript_34672:113-955(-)